MNRHISLVCLLALVIAVVTPAGAAPVEFTREYTYPAGEADSKLTCRAITLEQIKRLLLEELGKVCGSCLTFKYSPPANLQMSNMTL
jgi:hypothetical protein